MPTRTELAQKARHAWARIPESDYRPTGRLVIRLEHSSGQSDRASRSRFADGVRASVEAKVPELVDELLARASATAAQRRERERLDDLNAAERVEAIAQARRLHLDDLRAAHLWRQAERWSEARLLRDFVTAVAGRAGTETEQEWLAWASRRADQLDPPTNAPPAQTCRSRWPPTS